MDFENLKYKHQIGCTCDKEIHKNSISDEQSEVEYDAFCKECGAYLYHFCYGHYEE